MHKNKQNKGVSYTRNQGIEEAKAPYIMFTDSDDWGLKIIFQLCYQWH